MVYRRKRMLAAAVLRDFRDGKITNDEFVKRWPRNKGDRVFGALFEQLWFYYDDIQTHRLTGKYELPPVIRELFDRCIFFLESGLEYDWPEAKFGDIHFLFDCPSASVRFWFSGWTFLWLTGVVSFLIGVASKWYPQAGCLVPVVFLVWIMYGFGWLVYGVVLLIRRVLGHRPEPVAQPEIKYQEGKAYWPFHSRPECSDC